MITDTNDLETTRSVPSFDNTQPFQLPKHAIVNCFAPLSEEWGGIDTSAYLEPSNLVEWNREFQESADWQSRQNTCIALERLSLVRTRALVECRQRTAEGESSRAITRAGETFDYLRTGDDEWQVLSENLNSFRNLNEGWNGYSAPSPSQEAVRTARTFLRAVRSARLLPDRLKPSAVGGIGMTFRRDSREVYVEFYNNGTVYALFSASESDMQTRQIAPTFPDFQSLSTQIKDHLNG